MAEMKNMTVLLVFASFIALSNCLVKVLDPPELAGEYDNSKLNLYPREFSVVGQLVLGDPYNGCSDLKNSDSVKGKIVILDSKGSCETQEKTKRVAESGGIGVLFESNPGSFGIYYYYGGSPDSDVLMPALSVIKIEKIIDYLEKNNNANVTVMMEDTDSNPYLEYAHSGYGIVFQVFFEVFAFVTMVIASYKLYLFVYFRGWRPNITKVSLLLEICACILRMVTMIKPLSFYGFFSPLAEAFIFGYSNCLSFMTDLLITFYWQEVLLKCDRQLSNRVLENLDRLKIPFAIVCAIVWILDTIANLGRGHAFNLGDNLFFSDVVYTIFIFFIAVFFIGTGIKILKVTGITGDTRKAKRLSKLMIVILVTGALLIIQIVAAILYITPVAQKSNPITLFLFWLWWTGLYGVSLTKVIMFESPRGAKTTEEDSGDKTRSMGIATSNTIEITTLSREEDEEAISPSISPIQVNQ